ncbi:MAG: hypothetical protein E2O76_14690 [Caldithrix sp.]|nr:MAG: hypothetical protein E2O76_14690 [Caldithrix sp.]
MRRKKIIIGIHGAGNKPPQRLLQLWWQKAICEGLKRVGQPRRIFKVELVYWAHFLYSEPQSTKVSDPRSPLHINEPYVPAALNSVAQSPSRVRKKFLDWLEIMMDKLMLSENRLFNFDRIAEYIIRKKFRDLELYFHRSNVELDQVGLYAKKLIRKELAQILRKHRKKDILLISHSMGTVISYDVLTQLVPDIRIHTFITLGSPLGLPAVIRKIFTEQHKDLKNEKLLATPENIRQSWFNFSDLNDRVALDYKLRNDFKQNVHGIGPKDTIVHNDYENKGEKDHHKSFGYLRTPEVAEVILSFLADEKSSPLELVKRFLTIPGRLAGR